MADLEAQAYRLTYGRDDVSQAVGVWVLERGGLLKKIETDEQRVLHNFAVEQLEKLGLNPDNYRAVLKSLQATVIRQDIKEGVVKHGRQ